ncbi:Frk1p [Rhizophagus irregularis DAOM 197198w]|uniref:Frk1p n=2 Tax=Rhizophagus irregularis TaxID=588596 RepID=A0A015IR16_RHIIW|nr:Frk1p [Rhizophagus irregularis DAOM 197198w]
MQLKINSHNDIVFEWIPYSQLDDIKKIGEGDFAAEVYSAIWKNGMLYYDYSIHEYKRTQNKKVTLKYLYNSQNITNVFINKIKAYPVYGISQHPETKDYVIVFQYSEEKCTITMDKKILTNWTSGNDNIDELIQEMQSRINSNDDIVFESVPYSQFDNIKEVGQGGFAKVYSAIWKNGPLYYNSSNEYIRIQNKKVALKCLHNSQNISNKFLNEVKAYSIKKYDDYAGNNVLKIYGISQSPNTKDYIMVLDYAKGGNFDHWVYKNYRNFNWSYKLTTLWNIIKGLEEIHQKQLVHNDFHTGNILLNVLYVNNLNDNSIYVSDMGLCGKADDVNQNNIYGVMPYVAPEVLKGKPYTQAADIYSFGMIMYFVGTGKQPFSDCAHDKILALKICNGIRPEINESEAPKCFIDLMKKCWDSNPGNRPKITEILELIDLYFCSYKYDKFAFKRIVKIKKEQQHYEIEKQFKKTEEYRKSHLTPFDENKRLTTHPQAFYTSRLLNPFTEDLPKDDNIGNNSVEVFDFTK